MKKYKIIIYSRKKIIIQLLYRYIREYIEKNKKEKMLSVMIEGKNTIEAVDEELYSGDSVCLFVFDCSDKEEIENVKKILNKKPDNIENISKYKELVYTILLNNTYWEIEENVSFQKYDNLCLINDLQELTAIVEKVIYADDDSKKASDNLTRREREILVLITKGKLNKEIANELNITERTVKNHIANLFKKINVYDRTQAAVYAIKSGIYSLYLEDL